MSTQKQLSKNNNNNIQAKIDEEFAVMSARFTTLCSDCRLSFLEIKLYKKYFVDTIPKTQEKLNRLKLIIDTLEKHRKNTINVLKTIHEREAIVDAINGQIERISSSANRNASILDFQSDGLHLIYLHQQVTLRVVEAVESWRRPLTRPFPFIHQGENYFAKILADATDISASSLGKILPVKLNQYPLCSDLPSLCLFATPNPAAAAGRSGAAVGAGGGGKQPTSRVTSEMTQKINSAQAILLEEIETQKRLLRELEGLSTAGFFLPVLNLHSIIPSCSTGIRMSNHEWEEQLREAIAEAKDDLESAQDRAQHPSTSGATNKNNNNQNANQKNNTSKDGNSSNNKKKQQNNKNEDGKYEDDFSNGSTSPATSSAGSSRASSASPDERPQRNQTLPPPNPAPPSSTATTSQRRVSIDEKPRPNSASNNSNNNNSSSQPQPPPRPTSAKKRSETPTSASLPPAPPTKQAKDQDEGFEKESSSSSSSSDDDE